MSLRPNKGRAIAAITFLSAGMLTQILAITTIYSQLDALRGAQQGRFISLGEAAQMQSMALLVAAVNGLVSLGTIITFIMWFRRGYFNLHLKIDNLRYSEGWAAGGWFVPFLNFVRPVEIMSEMSNRTHEILEENGLVKSPNPLKWIIPLWWTLWVGVGVYGSVINFSADKASLDGLVRMSENLLISHYSSFVMAIVAIVMVRMYSRMEEKLPEVDSAVRSNRLSDNDLLDA